MPKRPTHRPAPNRIRVLLLAAGLACLLLVGLFFAWKLRKESMIRTAFAQGNAAYDRGDWPTARAMLGRYVSARPEDLDALAKYGEAQLNVRPVIAPNLRQAMGAFRQILRARPGDDAAFVRLARLYLVTGAPGELDFIAARRLESLPGDPRATLARAQSLIARARQSDAIPLLESLAETLEPLLPPALPSVAPSTPAGPRVPSTVSTPDNEVTSETPHYFVEACILRAALAARELRPGGDSRNEPTARGWLDRAVDRVPASPRARVQRAALSRAMPTALGRPLTADDLAAVRADLEVAHAAPDIQPQDRLALIEEWLNHASLNPSTPTPAASDAAQPTPPGAPFERARSAVAAARAADPQAVADQFIDPAEWTLALYRLESRLLMLTNDVPAAVKLTQDALEELDDLPQRTELLPLAIEVFVTAGMLDDARARCGQYENAPPLGPPARKDDHVALLRSIIARAESRPYEIINRLEGRLRGAGDLAPAMRTLLADAYGATGQFGRLDRTLGEDLRAAAASPAATIMLARTHLESGDFARTLQLLDDLDAGATDVESQSLRLTAEISLAFEKNAPPEHLDALQARFAALRDAHPRRADLRVLLAALNDARGRTAQAEAVLAAAAQDSDDPLRVRLALARLHVRHEQFAAAEQVLDQACRDHADRAGPWLALADFLAMRGRIDGCRALFDRALETVTAAAERRSIEIARSIFNIQRGDRPAGIAALQALAAADPGDVRTRAILLSTPDFLRDPAAQETIKELKTIEGAAGVEWRLHQARLLLSDRAWSGRPDARREVESLLKFCLDADPRWVAPALALGEAYEQLGDFKASEQVYTAGLRTTGAIEVADRLLALYQRQKRFSDARDVLKQLEPRLSEQATAARRVALAVGEGRLPDALRELEQRVTDNGGDAQDLVRLAKLTYVEKKDAAAAFAMLDRAATAGAPPADVTHTRVTILSAEGQVAQAVAALDALVSSSPTADSFSLRAAFHASIGNNDLAERDYLEFARLTTDEMGPAALGEFYAQSGDLDRAIATWNEGLKSHPNSDRLKRGMAKALLMRNAAGDMNRAGELLVELANASPDDTGLLWLSALHLASQNTPQKHKDALTLIERSVVGPAASAEAYRGLAALAMQLSAAKTARDVTLRGLQLYPGDRALLLARARAELETGEAAAAVATTRGLLEGDARDVAAFELAMEAANRQNNREELAKGLERAARWLESEPGSEALYLIHARLHIALDQNDLARDQLLKFCATETGAKSLPAWILLANIGLQARDMVLAQRAVDAAASIAPDDAATLRTKWSLFAAQGRADELLSSAQSSATAQQRPDLLADAATRLGGMGRHLDAAAQLCERALQLDAQNAAAHFALGSLCYQRRDTAGAERAFRAAASADPNHADALNNLAWLLAERNASGDEAIRLASRAELLRPNDANILDTRGFVLRTMGRLQEARAAFQRAADLAVNDAEVRGRANLHLAQTCAELQDWTCLRDSLSACLEDSAPLPFFTAEERVELDRLRAAASQSSRR